MRDVITYFNIEQEINFKDKLYLNYDFFSEKFLKICNREMIFRNIGFNTISMDRVYEIIGNRKQMVAALFYKCLTGIKGNIIFLIRYNELHDFIINNYMRDVNCSEFMKDAGKAMAKLYTEQFSKILDMKIAITEPYSGNGFLENIFKNSLLGNNIFSLQAYFFQGFIEKDIFQCEYTVIYVPQCFEANKDASYSLN